MKQAAELFEEVHVLIAVNSSKNRRTDEIRMKSLIEKSIDSKNVVVKEYDSLIATYCERNSIQYLIRGLRNTSDYLYEENIAKINQEINPYLKTVYFRANNEVISSSMVYELYRNGQSIQKYIPYAEKELIWC